jgi:hypothetical protein
MTQRPVPGPRPDVAGRAGLALTGLSVAATFTVAVTGISVMEPPLPAGLGGGAQTPTAQPPWAFEAHLSPYLAIALTAVGLLAGTAGLALTLSATRRGWRLPVRALLLAGLLAALALTLVPPFGSSDPLSYAAYGRILVTGHNPYVVAPDVLARMGDPVARAVQDWKYTPSDYGTVATAGQALASFIGGTSARLTVFVLSVLNLAAFAGTGLILHRLFRGDRARQARAALLWTANPLLLQVLVAGQHVDSQAIFFGVAAVAVFVRRVAVRPVRQAACWAAAAGALAGLGFAVKITLALVGGGLALAVLQSCWSRWRRLIAIEAGLAVGFAVVAGAALAAGGAAGFRQTVQASSMVSIGSPWRVIRTLLHLVMHESTADDLVKTGAALLAVILAVLLWRGLPGGSRWASRPWNIINKKVPSPDVQAAAAVTGAGARPPARGDGPASAAGLAGGSGSAGTVGPEGLAGLTESERMARLAGRGALALSLAWLLAWPYVLPWYDGLAWALLPLIAASSLDWLLLARTAALGVGYLPARAAGVVIPPGLGWLQSVVRTGVTPAILAIVVVWLIVTLRRPQAGAGEPSVPVVPAVAPEPAVPEPAAPEPAAPEPAVPELAAPEPAADGRAAR